MIKLLILLGLTIAMPSPAHAADYPSLEPIVPAGGYGKILSMHTTDAMTLEALINPDAESWKSSDNAEWKKSVEDHFKGKSYATRAEIDAFIRGEFDKRAMVRLGDLKRVSAAMEEGSFLPDARDLKIVFRSFGRPTLERDGNARQQIESVESSGRPPPADLKPGSEEYLDYYENVIPGLFTPWRAGRYGTSDQNTWNGRYGDLSRDRLMLIYFQFANLKKLYGEEILNKYLSVNGRLNEKLKYTELTAMLAPEQKQALDKEILKIQEQGYHSAYIQLVHLNHKDYNERWHAGRAPKAPPVAAPKATEETAAPAEQPADKPTAARDALISAFKIHPDELYVASKKWICKIGIHSISKQSLDYECKITDASGISRRERLLLPGAILEQSSVNLANMLVTSNGLSTSKETKCKIPFEITSLMTGGAETGWEYIHTAKNCRVMKFSLSSCRQTGCYEYHKEGAPNESKLVIGYKAAQDIYKGGALDKPLEDLSHYATRHNGETRQQCLDNCNNVYSPDPIMNIGFVNGCKLSCPKQ